MNEIVRSATFSEAAGRFSAREFIRMKELGAFDGMRVELVQGLIVRMNPPFLSHGMRQALIIYQLFLAYESAGVIISGDTGIQLDAATIRAFDAVVARDEPADMKLLVPENVLLAVEIADTSLAKDLGPKRDDYAKAGIPVYWVVDLNARCVHVLAEPVDGQYRNTQTRTMFDELTPPGASKPIQIVW